MQWGMQTACRRQARAGMLYQVYQIHADVMDPVRAWASNALQAISPGHMVGIADNFARALAAVPAPVRDAADPQLKAVLDGVEATDRQLIQTLERYGVKAVDVSGKFDPNVHQAIAEVPGQGKPAGNIVDVVQTGYMIGDRLLRPAMVTVAKNEVAAAGVDSKV